MRSALAESAASYVAGRHRISRNTSQGALLPLHTVAFHFADRQIAMQEIISYHIVSYHTVSDHFVSYRTIPVASERIIPNHFVPNHTRPFWIIPNHTEPYHTEPFCIIFTSLHNVASDRFLSHRPVPRKTIPGDIISYHGFPPFSPYPAKSRPMTSGRIASYLIVSRKTILRHSQSNLTTPLRIASHRIALYNVIQRSVVTQRNTSYCIVSYRIVPHRAVPFRNFPNHIILLFSIRRLPISIFIKS